MADQPAPVLGAITWTDLTVPDAPTVRDFYAAVCGWRVEPVSMGDYDDFNMIAPGTGTPVAGICHARGANADLPAQWLHYVTVADLDASLSACTTRGGTVLRPATPLGSYGRLAVIRDPAGAVLALMEPPR